MKRLISMLIATLLCWGDFSAAFAAPPGETASGIRLLQSDARGIVLELNVGEFHVESFGQDGQTYQRFVIPEMRQSSQPGEPQVPTRGVMLGVPTLARLRLEILAAEFETLQGYRLPAAASLEFQGVRLDDPAASLTTAYPTSKVFTTDAFYPGRPVEIGFKGQLRDQPVAQVQFSPLQYNPVRGEVRLYRRLLVSLTWEAQSFASPSQRLASPAYEGVLKNSLMNYPALERPVIAVNHSSPKTPQSGLLPTSVLTPTLKIGVDADGLYQLSYGDLDSAGLAPATFDPRTIKINNRGAELPILVQGEEDGIFDAGDVVLFYGTAITDVYTTENIYWLAAGGDNGQRMAERDGTPGGASIPADFPATHHAEEDTVYWQTMPNGAGEDHWFWEDRLSPNTTGLPAYRDHTINLANLSAGATSATVRVRLKGYTNDYFFDSDHNTRIYLNDNLVDDQVWDGFNIFDHQVTVPHSYLVNGVNTVRVEAADTGAVVDQLFVNWIEVDYRDTYNAEADELLFAAPTAATHRFEVKNFTSDAIQVFDITDPANPVVIANASILPDEGDYKVAFQDNALTISRYLALAQAQSKSPARIELDQPSDWKSTAHGVDYIIITHEDFYTNTIPLADYRASQGLRVATVKVHDIYDEFNAGIFNPQAIRDFLEYAYENWQTPAPAYVLLVGEASYDYRGTLGDPISRVNYVPTQMIETFLLGQTASDNWFVAFGDDELLPQMFISRLPTSNIIELDVMIGKILFYEQNPPDSSWNENVLLVADDDETSFEYLSEDLVARTPYYYNITRVYARNYPPGDPTVDITNKINSGSLLVNYTGHGNPETWGIWSGGRIFDDSDVASLSNADKYPVVTVANCLNGFFVGRTNPSMAEQFLQLAGKGAVAVWAPTGLGDTAGHRDLLDEFYDAIFQDDLYQLGEATTVAKINLYSENGFWGELVETYVLFGDPATRLGLPTNYPYLKSTTPENGSGPVPRGLPVVVEFSKPMDPTTVSLTGGGLTFTAAWNEDQTVVTYTHQPFTPGQSYTLTISGKDQLGNSLGVGLAPATWSFTAANMEIFLPVVFKGY